MSNKKGIFITFEGGEGAGKTTLISSVMHELQSKGLETVSTRAPGGTFFGNKIRNILLHETKEIDPLAELFLFLGDRVQHVHEVIKPALGRNALVLCDRFHDSTIAYQGVGRALNATTVRSLCDLASGGLWPDLTFYLDIDPKIGLARVAGEKDRLESEAFIFHEKIRTAFHTLAKQEPGRIVVIDASRLKEQVVYEVLTKIYALF